MDDKPRKLLDRVRDEIRVRQYSHKTEKSYVRWIKEYICFHGVKHPREMREREIQSFLTFLAVQRKVAPSTQNQAFSAL